MDSDQLPPDMVFEVLSRTTLETLDTCKAVSKEWKKIIYDSSFMLPYLERTNNLFGYIIQNLRSCKYISTFVSVDPSRGDEVRINGSSPSDDIKILASCKQGLLCCEKQGRYPRYYVAKPATRQWRSLPNPKLRFWTVAVGIMVAKSKPLHFKIVRLSKDKQSKKVVSTTKKYYCEIFDSHIWAWRAAKGIILPYDEALTCHQTATYVGESFYWQTNENNVLSFDVANQHFRIFSLPESVCNKDAYKETRLVEYEGGLGLTCLSVDGNMELWQWRKKREWTSRSVVDMSRFESSTCPIGFCNSDVAVMKTYDQIVFYKLVEGRFTEVYISIDFSCSREIFQFQSDLESVDF